MSTSELWQTKLLLDSLLASEENAYEREVYEMLSRALSAGRYGHPPMFKVFKKTDAYKPFREALPVAQDFIDRYLQPQSKPEQKAAFYFLFRTIISHIKQAQQAPVCAKSVATHLKRAEELVEWQFPGYASAGLLASVAKLK